MADSSRIVNSDLSLLRLTYVQIARQVHVDLELLESDWSAKIQSLLLGKVWLGLLAMCLVTRFGVHVYIHRPTITWC